MTSGSRQLIVALGGAENVVSLESCAMRIRAQVREPQLVDEALIRQANPIAVVRSGNFVQIVVATGSGLLEQLQAQLV